MQQNCLKWGDLATLVSLQKTVLLSQITDTGDSGIANGTSPQGRNQLKFSMEDGDESRRLDAMLAWIRETWVWNNKSTCHVK